MGLFNFWKKKKKSTIPGYYQSQSGRTYKNENNQTSDQLSSVGFIPGCSASCNVDNGNNSTEFGGGSFGGGGASGGWTVSHDSCSHSDGGHSCSSGDSSADSGSSSCSSSSCSSSCGGGCGGD